MIESEDNLIRRVQKGERECFGHLYDQYMSKIYRYVLMKVSNVSEAEDLTHEVFVSAFENLRGYRPKGYPFSTWLYHIARNKVIDYYRTHKIHVNFENIDENVFKVVGAVEQGVDLNINFGRVKSAMLKLSEDHQDILIMRFIDDLSPKEIAQALDKTEGAVRLMQHRALQNLRELLKDSDLGQQI